jgi:hypothetical protein
LPAITIATENDEILLITRSFVKLTSPLLTETGQQMGDEVMAAMSLLGAIDALKKAG